MPFPPTDKSMAGVLRDTLERMTLVERRLAVAGGGGGGEPATIHPTGDVWQVTDDTLPPGTLWCDGRAVSRTTYATLFAEIGTTYGRGDGSTTFNLPNLNGRQLIVPTDAPLARWNMSNVFVPLSSAEGVGSVPDTYEIRAQFTPGALPRARFSTGGVDNSSATYQFSRSWLNQTALQRAYNGNVPMIYLSSSAGGRQTLQMMVMRPNAPDYTDFTWTATERNTAESPMLMDGVGSFYSNTAFDGITFFAESGTMSGWMQVIPFGGSMVPSVIATTPIKSGVVGTGQSTGGGGGGTTIVQSGLVLLRPTSVVGGTIVDNQVKFSGVSAVSLNNIFDGALYDDYVIEVRFASVPSGGWLRMRKAGVDTTSAMYGNQQTYNSTASALTTGYAATVGWVFTPQVGLEEKLTAKLSRPFSTGESVFLDMEQTTQLSNGILSGTNKGTTTAIGYDGFTIQAAGGTFSGTITVYGMSKMSGGLVPPQGNLWQEFSLSGAATIPVTGGSPAWNVVKGNLGVTQSADKTTLTLPSAGTYRILPHFGLSGADNGAANANATIAGVNYEPSFSYGEMGPAGAWSYDTEFYITVTGPTTLRHYVSSASLYNWSWLRIEKQEPVAYGNALAIQQGSTLERDVRYGVPANDQEKASLANRLVSWFNTDKGYFEVYYATTGTTGLYKKGLATGFPAGWYPAAGTNIWGTCLMLTEQAVAAGEVRINLNTGELVGGITTGNNVMIIPVGGIYEISGHLYQWAMTGSYRGVQAFNVADGTVHFSGTTSANWDIVGVPRRSRIAANVQIGLRTSGDAASTMRGQNWPALEIKYMGPPLATG